MKKATRKADAATVTKRAPRPAPSLPEDEREEINRRPLAPFYPKSQPGAKDEAAAPGSIRFDLNRWHKAVASLSGTMAMTFHKPGLRLTVITEWATFLRDTAADMERVVQERSRGKVGNDVARGPTRKTAY